MLSAHHMSNAVDVRYVISVLVLFFTKWVNHFTSYYLQSLTLFVLLEDYLQRRASAGFTVNGNVIQELCMPCPNKWSLGIICSNSSNTVGTWAQVRAGLVFSELCSHGLLRFIPKSTFSRNWGQYIHTGWYRCTHTNRAAILQCPVASLKNSSSESGYDW